MKLCFISYARNSYARNSNLDGRLAKFVQRLEKMLPAHLPHGTKPEDIIFFDAQSIENSDEWMTRLADASRLCKVCVCFYSVPYFTSEYSGREVQVFLQRVQSWNQVPANAGRQAKAIIPVIWVPFKDEEVPQVLQPYQWSNVRLPAKYVSDGLYALALLKSRADAYNTVLIELAKQIAATVTAIQLPDGAPIASFDAVASAFHGTTTPVRYGASVMILAAPNERALPFGAGSASLYTMIEEVANRSTLLFRETKLSATAGDEIKKSIAAREMPVLIADRASLESPNNAALVASIAGALNASGTALVFGAAVPTAADAAAQLRAVAAQRLAPWSTGVGATGCVVATDPASFSVGLERRLHSVRKDLVAADPAARAVQPDLEAGANARGIKLGARLVLSATGG